MTGEATDLVARLRERATYDKKFYPPADPMWTEAATLIEAQAAEIEGLAGAMPDLFSVIGWLENGCDPKHAATELRIYQERIDHARRAFLTSRTERSDA